MPTSSSSSGRTPTSRPASSAACSRATACRRCVSSGVRQSRVSADGQRAGRGARSPCRADDADEARRDHREPPDRGGRPAGSVRLRDEFEALQQAHRLPLPRSRPARARDDPHARAPTRTSAAAWSTTSRSSSSATRCSASSSPTCCSASSRRSTRGRSRRSRRRWSRPTTLARQAERLRLGDHLLLGRGEEKTGGRRKQALLADGYEALIAAIYLDGGIEQARAFIAREFAALLAEMRDARRCRPATTSRRCRSSCSRTTGRCRSTASAGTTRPRSPQAVPGRSGGARARCSPPGPGRARRKRSRRRRGRALEKLELRIRTRLGGVERTRIRRF